MSPLENEISTDSIDASCDAGPIRILIAEDDPTSCEILKVVLGEWGYVVNAFPDGASAFEELKHDKGYAVAILDWNIPGLNGIEICEQLIKTESLFTYFILLTSKYGLADVIKGFASGAHDYITKPFEPEELHARVKVGIRLYKMHHQIEMYASSMEQLANERAKQLLHADRLSTLGVLSAGIAHEINNPLSFIQGNNQFLAVCWPAVKETLSQAHTIGISNSDTEIFCEEFESSNEAIKKGVIRISKIIKSLKQYARKESGERKPCSLVQLIEEALLLCSSHLQNSIQIDFDRSADFKIYGDLQQIEQVFINLLVNSADALGDYSPGKISISLHGTDSEVTVQISDNGPGFSDVVLKNLFTPFFTTKDIGKGTGLGLSICEGIIKEHGGSIRAFNNTSHGAVFEITFPYRSGESA